MATEGQVARGPNGERAVFTGGQWVIMPENQGGGVALPSDPMRGPQLRTAQTGASVAEGTAPTTIQTNQAPSGTMWVDPRDPSKGVIPIPGAPEKPGATLTPGQLKVDQDFATTYNEWRASGGYQALENKLVQLDDAIKILESGDTISGPLIGRLPKWVRQAINPDGPNVQQQVEKVVQESLKQVLGGQFAAREADQLFQRSIDPTAQEAANVKRIRAQIDDLRAKAVNQEAAAQYFEENGTLVGFRGPTPEQISAFDVVRQRATQQTQASERQDVGAGGTTTDNYPQEMVERHDALVARLIGDGGGRLDPKAYAVEREKLFNEFGYASAVSREENERWATSVNEYLDSGGRTIPSGIAPAERLMSATETMRNNLANNPVGGAVSGFANMMGGGIPQALLPDQYMALGDAQGGFQMAGEMAGAIGGTMGVGAVGRYAAQKAAPSLLGGGARSQFGRNLATDATYGGIVGGTTEGDPLTGVALGGVGSAAGQGVARGVGAAVGGAQISEAAQRLKDQGVPISVARQLGLGRAEDAMQSVPIVGDMSRARQLDSFRGLQMAAMREGGQPIGFNPTRAGREGLEDFGQARSQFYENTLDGVNAPLDEAFIQDMMPVRDIAQSLSQSNRRKLGETINDAMQIPGDAGAITGRQYQDALVALKRLRNNPGEAMPNAAETLRRAATQSIGALDNAITRGAGSEVVAGLGRANQANRSFKTLEDAMNRAAGGSQTGEIFLPTPFQMQQAGLATQRKYPGERPFAQLADDAQTILPSKLPNSGTTDRAIMTGILGTAGLGAGIGGGSGFAGGGDNAGANAASGAQDGAITGATLAAALALLGTRGGQAALETALIRRPQALQTAGQAIRRRKGLFGSAAVPIALDQY
jgi:hypothetical protein